MQASQTTFEIQDSEETARTGTLRTPHGCVSTPAFMPVATFGAVRGIAASDLQGIGAEILLSNTYHLHERPGEETIAELGGLHGFTGWQGPWLTDSGGYQVSSLSQHMKLSEEGVTFRSPLDGASRMLTPENTVAIQEALGSDIAMILDECVAPTPEAHSQGDVKRATERTLRWAERAARARQKPEQAVFGIVQGGTDTQLRQHSARGLCDLGFDGFAHGGLGLGENRTERCEAVAAAREELPATAPRYLMGLGRPIDLIDGVAEGVDLFDCVVPTRNGRHGLLFTSRGLLHIKNARFASDDGPIDPECDCPACTSHSRAYLRHLIRCQEALGSRLAALHNLRFYLRLLEQAREAITQGRFAAFRAEQADKLEASAD
ncbi:MAG: tRNA guanosine(34) transglycosylase Tgt [Myxococcota bacterium]|nr:tRNA guanosine(34) transglycosylase Tgt [Myxococcota bacterium]